MKNSLTHLTIALSLLLAVPAKAQQYDIQGVASVEVVPGYRTAKGTRMAAIRIHLQEGWKTYWRAPGGNGIPPQFVWSGSENLAGVAFHWPAPHVYVQDGIRTIGYKNELVLPVELKAKDANAPIKVSGSIEFGVCSDVCIPASGTFSTVINSATTSGKSLIKAALATAPLNARKGGVKSARCVVKPIRGGFNIVSEITLKRPAKGGTFTVLEYRNPDVWADTGKTVQQGNTLTTSTDLYAFTDEPLSLDRSRLRLTLLGGSKAVELNGCAG